MLGVPALGLLTTSDVQENAATAVAVDVVLVVAEGLVGIINRSTDGVSGQRG